MSFVTNEQIKTIAEKVKSYTDGAIEDNVDGIVRTILATYFDNHEERSFEINASTDESIDASSGERTANTLKCYLHLFMDTFFAEKRSLLLPYLEEHFPYGIPVVGKLTIDGNTYQPYLIKIDDYAITVTYDGGEYTFASSLPIYVYADGETLLNADGNATGSYDESQSSETEETN